MLKIITDFFFYFTNNKSGRYRSTSLKIYVYLLNLLPTALVSIIKQFKISQFTFK